MRALRIFGLVLLVAAPFLAVGYHYSINEPLRTLAWVEQHRAPADSLAYASALYHGSRARVTVANRWHLTGYATLGLVGTLLGVGLLVSSRTRRRDLTLDARP